MPDSWLATEKPVFLSDFGCRSVGGQQKNQSLKEGVICYGRRTFLLNLPKYHLNIRTLMLMTKKQAIAIITKYAKQYQQYLEGNQVVFVYRDENNKSRIILRNRRSGQVKMMNDLHSHLRSLC